MDEVTLQVSHPSLVEGVRMGMSLGAGRKSEPKWRGKIQKKVQGKALNKVSNKLEIGPVSFKPVWSRPKISGVVLKERVGQKLKGQEAKAHGGRLG